jgi:ABC-2 type transport system ATP-binding protein
MPRPPSLRQGVLAGGLVLALVAGGASWWAATVEGPEPAGVAPRELLVEVGPEPDGTPVRLDAALYLPETTPAPAVLLAHGFGGSRQDLEDEAQRLVGEGYAVLAYTARGFGRSGGRIHLNSPEHEVADAAVLLDELAELDEVVQDGPGDPRAAIVGGSYGGALALMAAGADPRVDSVVAMITWNDLADAFFPQHAERHPGDALEELDSIGLPGPFKQLWASSFFAGAALAGTPGMAPPDAEGPVCGRFDPELCGLFLAAAETGEPSPELIDLLRQHSPAPSLHQVSAPVYLVQGMNDTLFGLEHADATARALQAAGTPVAVRWFNGGHDGDGTTGAGQTQGTEGGGPPQVGASSAARAAEAEREEQERTISRWLEGTLRDPGDDLPLPGFTYTLPHQRGQDVARTLTVADYSVLRTPSRQSAAAAAGDAPTGGGYARWEESLPLRPRGTPVVVNPPGGSPAAITAVPGLGSLGGSAPTYPLSALPGQHAAFDTEPLAEGVVVAGSPRVSLQVTSSAEEVTLFVSLWQVQGTSATMPRRLVAPVHVTTTPGEPQRVDVALPAATWDMAAGSVWRVLVSATDTAYRNPTGTRVDRITLADPALRLPALTGRPAAGPGLWDAEAVGVAVATALLLAGLGVLALRRRARHAEVREDLADVPLVVSGLSKRYPDGHRAVDNVTWRAEKGQVVGLLGPNGAGKSTTLRILSGTLPPDAGEVHVMGEPVRPGAPVLRRVGMLVEGPGFLPHLSGRENLRAFWAATGRPEEEARFEEVLEVAALGGAADRPVKAYSHGMKQRLGIAQAMLGMPEVLILDEPTNGLDPPQIAAMRPILRRYAAGGRTVIVSSHLLAEVEMTCSHVVVMHMGRVLAAGSVTDIGVDSGHTLEEVFLSTIAGIGAVPDDPVERNERLRQVRPR